MKANELRIGNTVLLQKDKIISVSNATFINIERHAYNYDPIPITEEWLVRFGFEIDQNTYLYSKSGYTIDFAQYGYVEFYLAGYGSWFKILESVHQLQNLYFALTGEELKLNEETL
jgi:hypothetical protein